MRRVLFWFVGLAVAMAGLGGCVPASGQPVAAGDTPLVESATLPAATTTRAACRPSMTLHERAGQVLVAGLPGVLTPDHPLVADVQLVGVGGILLTGQNVDQADQVLALVRGLKAGPGIDPLIAVDEEAGRVSAFRDIFGPTSSPRTMAQRSTAEEVRAFARDLGQKLASFGVELDLAPVAGVDGGPSGGVIGDRAFSSEPEVAGDYALAFSEGLAAGGVLPTVKHFPGNLAAGGDPHDGMASVDTSVVELRADHLPPFVQQLEAGVPVVMVGHLTYSSIDPTRPASLSPRIYELLRSLGFQGVAITDSVGMGAVWGRWKYHQSAVAGIAAGADAILVTDGTAASRMRDALVAAVRSGRLPRRRLDQAAARMLALKGLEPHSLTCHEASSPRMRTAGTPRQTGAP